METILLVEEDPRAAGDFRCLLAEDYRVLHCPEPRRAAEAARLGSPAAIVLSLPPACARRGELVRRTADESGGAPLVVLSSDAEPAIIVECLRSGAYDFLKKPFDIRDLRRSLESAIVPRKIGEGGRSPFIGSSPAIKAVEDLVRAFAGSSFPVLITGESGTGKEIAARALHDLAPRGAGPFVARNCAAIPDQLAESELFGTEKGAFTDAVPRPGAFEIAMGGLLFLDEIGEASLAFQAKLLRVLESGEFQRLGGRVSVEADFRFVSATCRDLERAVAEGSFRSDLLYRVNTLAIAMPSLRVRREDIAELASHFALTASRGRMAIGRDAMDKLLGYDWPGNIRQLRNIVHRSLVLAGDSGEIQARHVVF
jgi:DNA-binding NtrC family response regulator